MTWGIAWSTNIQSIWLAECYFKQTITWMEAILHRVDMENVPFVPSSFIYLNLSAGILPSTACPCYISIYNFRSWLERILGVCPRTEATKPFFRTIRGIFAVKDLTQPEPEKSQCISETLSAAVCLGNLLFKRLSCLRSRDFSKGPNWVRNWPSEAGKNRCGFGVGCCTLSRKNQ